MVTLPQMLTTNGNIFPQRLTNITRNVNNCSLATTEKKCLAYKHWRSKHCLWHLSCKSIRINGPLPVQLRSYTLEWHGLMVSLLQIQVCMAFNFRSWARFSWTVIRNGNTILRLILQLHNIYYFERWSIFLLSRISWNIW